MAREMCLTTQHTGTKLGVDLNMRAGLHFGKIVGGVIGTNKLRYDIWGVDVITAHKLEANGTPGKVLASLGAYRLLKDTGFVFDRAPDLTFAEQKRRVYLHTVERDEHMAVASE